MWKLLVIVLVFTPEGEIGDRARYDHEFVNQEDCNFAASSLATELAKQGYERDLEEGARFDGIAMVRGETHIGLGCYEAEGEPA